MEIIEKVYEGFGEEAKAKILNSMLDQYQNSYDVYFETFSQKYVNVAPANNIKLHL